MEAVFLNDKSMMSRMIRAKDWAATAVGAIETWPQSLKTALNIALNSQFPMFLTWGPARLFFYNDAYSVILADKHPAAIGQKFEDVWSDIWSDVEPMVLEVEQGESVFLENMSFLMNRFGREEKTFFTFSYSPIRDEKNKIAGLFCACVETTKNIEAFAEAENEKKKAQEREQVLHFALSTGLMGTWTVDLKNSAVTMSEEAYKIFGIKHVDPSVDPIIDSVIHPDDRDEARSDLGTAIANHTIYRSEYRIIRPVDGIMRWVLATGQSRLDKNGAPFQFAGVIVDITERKEAERLLVEAKEEAENANQLKSAFLANMSHEIRTPLGAMLGFADLLRDPGITATERANFVDILSRNGESLSVIINDILDLSKVESGHLNVEYTDTYPDQIAADVVSLLRVKAKEKDLTLEYSHDESSPRVVTSDPTRVRQILLNIVANAIKFTQFGSVKIKAFGCLTDDGRPSICFEVKDTGIGIPRSQSEQIFEMFVQADGTMTRRFGGTGLGLALSRRLARILGGDVSLVESREGFGTTFLIKIEDRPDKHQPAELSVRQQPVTEVAAEGALKGIRVLVVDDAPDNQQLIWRYLTKQGALVESAENGLLGYRAALQGHSDIVLMDVQMPVMDGYTAASKLRESGFRKPIIALTAHAMNEVRKKALSVGYTDHLPKPINAKDLIAAIVRYVNESRAEH